MLAGHKKEVEKYKRQMMQYFKCDDTGESKDYVGCKFDRDQQGKCLKMTQPVIIQSFKDEFGMKLNKTLRFLRFLVKFQ
jgi:hypothetical protein